MKNIYKIKEIKNREKFSPLSLAPNCPFTQSYVYGLWQELAGRVVRRFLVINKSETISTFQVIKFKLPKGNNLLYIPHGPIVNKNITEEFLEVFLQKTKELCQEENSIFLRFDFSPSTFCPSPEIMKKFFHKASLASYKASYFQPKTEWSLSLKQSKDDILKEMHQKTRYNIRLAKKKGVEAVVVSENFNEYFDTFYQRMSETSKRGGFNLHSREYYKNIFNSCEEEENAFLVVVSYKEKILIINLIILFGKTANFLFGASSGEHRNLMPSYLSQWTGISEAKNRGYDTYNFGGFDEKEKIYKGWKELSIFKRKFGGQMLTHANSYDIVCQSFLYKLYILRKKLKSLIIKK